MRNAEEQQVLTGVITSLPTLTDIYGDQEASHPIMQLFWPKEMKEKHVSIGRPPINLQRQFSQDLKLKLFRHFVSGHDLCPPRPPPSGGRRHPPVASSSIYLLYLCGGPCPWRRFRCHRASPLLTAGLPAASEAGRAGPGLFITPYL